MTIITAINSGGSLMYGYNNGADFNCVPISNVKKPWLLFGNWAFGITGQSIAQDILARELPKLAKIEGGAEEVVAKIRKILRKNDVGTRSSNDYVDVFGINTILAHKNGDIWDLGNCLALNKVPEGRLWAKGSGADFAIGADYAICASNLTLSAEERLQLATRAAIENDIYCIGKAMVETL